jgi:hypothetical protein
MGELVSDEGIRQYLKFRATKEAYLARALFAGQVLAPYTQDRQCWILNLSSAGTCNRNRGRHQIR